MRQARELEERFGLDPDVLGRMSLQQAQSAVFVGTREAMGFCRMNTLRRGIRLCRLFPKTLKPTTAAMQVFGRWATRNCISVNKEQARRIINGDDLEIEAELEDGFVLIFWQEFVVGVGQYRRPRLSSCIPRYRPVD